MARAALEARGVPVRVDGAATHGVLGMIHGAALAPRVMVPRPWRATAREIVADIVGPFADEGDDAREDAAREALPFRVAGQDDGAPEDDAPDHDVDDIDDAPVPARRSLAIPVMLGMLAMPWGFGHVYARKPRIGVALMAVALVAAAFWVSGSYPAIGVLVAVALADVFGSMVFIARYNRSLRALPSRS
jgi:hypothetical protein